MKKKVQDNFKFSIIIPIYNCEKFLDRCISSILKQKNVLLELILVDDGSTDNSGAICDNYSNNDKRVMVIHKKNEGVSKARNTGLEYVTGNYIVFLDSDDYLEDNYFDFIVKSLSKEKYDLLNFAFFSDVETDELKLKSSDIITYKDTFYTSKNEIKNDLVNLMDNSMLYNIWNKVYLTSIIKDNNIIFPDYNWGEDVEFNRCYLNKINTMANYKNPFYHYIREREGAATKKYKSNLFEIRKKEFDEFNAYFELWQIKKEDYYEFSCRRYIERVLGCIENIYCSEMNFMQRYREIKKINNDLKTREAIKHIKPKSKKVKIMIIPIRFKLNILTMFMGRTFNILKNKFPSLFNKLKNRR